MMHLPERSQALFSSEIVQVRILVPKKLAKVKSRSVGWQLVDISVDVPDAIDAILLANLEWPDYCVSCGTPKPTCAREIVEMEKGEVRIEVPICRVCSTLEYRENPIFLWSQPILFLICFFGVVTVTFWGAIPVARLLGFVIGEAFAPIWLGGLIVLVAAVRLSVSLYYWSFFWIVHLATRERRRIFAAWEFVPRFRSVTFRKLEFLFANGKYAREFARVNRAVAETSQSIYLT